MHTVYILDFGIARKYTNHKGELKTRRAEVRFKGTVGEGRCGVVVLPAIGSHRQGLPWKKIDDKNIVQGRKEEARKDKDLYGTLKCKNDYQKILTYIDRLEYTDHVDYQFIYEKLKRIAAQQSINIDDPYDFEPPSKK
ncbi:unnamed protein product, partial [Mesorhabditis belari]|uniref:Protein kinase domain-containing protein n=1 Tax=Mesorhabditis belari TaxID=2138241 RepID=A0AAF3J5Q6_9BILA